MNARAQALWARMRAAGATSAEAPAVEETPWYLAALSGVAAWIATAFLIGFFLALFDDLWRTPGLSFPIGAGCCVFAIVVLRHARGREFFEQFAIAAGLVGQWLIGIAFEHWSHSGSGAARMLAGPDWHLVWSGVGLVALAMYALGPSRMHRFLCAGILAAAMIGVCFAGEDAVGRLALPLLAWTTLGLWWRSAARDRLAPTLPPMAWALSLFALGLAWFSGPDAWLFDGRGRSDDGAWAIAGQVLVVPLLPACAYWLLSRQGAALSAARRTLAFALAAAFALLWWRAPGVNLGVCLVLIGFALYRPALIGVGAFGLVVYLLRYYYQLDLSLSEKSGWLVAGGAALLAARWASLRALRGEAS